MVTTHGEYGVFARACVHSLMKHAPRPWFIVLVINVSDDPATADLERELESIKGLTMVRRTVDTDGLTGTWNLGANMCMGAGCSSVLFLNHDLHVDESIVHILEEANATPSTCLRYYGPLTNEPGPEAFNNAQRGDSPEVSEPRPLLHPATGDSAPVNGASMCIPVHVLRKNMFAPGVCFDPQWRYAGNEIEWFERLRALGGESYVVPKTFVHHYKFSAWRPGAAIGRATTCLYTLDGGRPIPPAPRATDCDALFYSPCPRRLGVAARTGWVPMLLVKAMGNDSLAPELDCKLRPHKYLPAWYDCSVFVDTGECPVPPSVSYLKSRYRARDHDILCRKSTRFATPMELAIDLLSKDGRRKPEFADAVVQLSRSCHAEASMHSTALLVRWHGSRRMVAFADAWASATDSCGVEDLHFDKLTAQQGLRMGSCE